MHKWLCLVLTLALSGSAYAFPFRSGGQLDGGPTLIATNVSSVFDEGQSGTVGVFIREPGAFGAERNEPGGADFQVTWTQVAGPSVELTFDGLPAAHSTAHFTAPQVDPAGAVLKYRYDVIDNNPIRFINIFVLLRDSAFLTINVRDVVSPSPAAVPLPASWLLLAMALMGCGTVRCRTQVVARISHLAAARV